MVSCPLSRRGVSGKCCRPATSRKTFTRLLPSPMGVFMCAPPDICIASECRKRNDTPTSTEPGASATGHPSPALTLWAQIVLGNETLYHDSPYPAYHPQWHRFCRRLHGRLL